MMNVGQILDPRINLELISVILYVILSVIFVQLGIIEVHGRRFVLPPKVQLNEHNICY